MSHRGYPGGHGTEVALLTGADARSASRPRYPQHHLARSGSRLPHRRRDTLPASSRSAAATCPGIASGVKVPSESRRPRSFANCSSTARRRKSPARLQRIQNGRSVLDGVARQARTLADYARPADRQRSISCSTSIREAEQRLQQEKPGSIGPSRASTVQPYTDDYTRRAGPADAQSPAAMVRPRASRRANRLDARRRLVALVAQENLNLEGVGVTHHDASHHGRDEAKIAQLALIEEAEMRLFAEFLRN